MNETEISLVHFTAVRFLENLGVLFSSFGLLYVVMYRMQFMHEYWLKRKYQPGVPSRELMIDETVRSIGSVMIGTLYETLFYYLQKEHGVMKHVDVVGNNGWFGDATLFEHFLVSGLFIPFWGDFHFYMTHRFVVVFFG